MWGEAVLGVWSCLGVAWWIQAWRLVAAENKASRHIPSGAKPREFLSVFKPLPPLGAGDLTGKEAALESFISQLDDESEILLGIHEADREATAAFLARLETSHPKAQIKVIFRCTPDDVANPKIVWQKILARQASGELWLWSDADIFAPPDFLAAIREEYARGEAKMLTFPYVLREMARPPALLDALYVNVDFYPGLLFLRRLGPVDFGLGAGMLFRRSDFLREVDWGQLGAELADDFILGQRLSPVRLSRTRVLTTAGVATWKAALLHYLRWSKTVWWSRPWGSAARIVVLPVVGWLIYVALHPARAGAWAGLAAMMQIDVFFAAALCREAGCAWRVRNLLATEAWSLGRIVVWVACWFPWPVIWQGTRWWGPRTK